MTLIKDLIDIPENVYKGDFVLKLTDGVTHPEETLRQYVVTPQLVRCFDDAMGFIQSAIQSRSSKATYLHGSFGSGKSHFMAVLHLILQGNPAARSILELAPVVSRHNAWTSGKRLLLVPFHLIGARDMESGILGGYVDFIREAHPEAPIPGVYLAEGLFQDAISLRSRIGDEAFFEAIGESNGAASSDWGNVKAGWDAARFDAAVAAPPGTEDRSRLISALVGSLFISYPTQVGEHGEAFLSLDKGLSVISKHAADLGYDGLILFLDELVLWLASRASDLGFIHREGQKLAKLVESQTADRPIPIISFVARQRDLRELIGDTVPGAERLNFGDSLGHWEGRFNTITLEDRNLPTIAEKRILKPRGEGARQEMDDSFSAATRLRESVLTALLTSEGDPETFRKVYPFSPALVQTLVAVSSVLQRERTALKVMMELLVSQRDTLQLGDIVPVGDLFDVVADGDEAFSQEMAIRFENARRLYHQKLLPLLLKDRGPREALDALPYTDPNRAAFRADDRLIKTLLLAALVPEVESLRGLTAERLAALNHGSIRSPIPGREASEVLRRCKSWAASVGEIRIGEESVNPTITIQLSGVDTNTIIEQARREDNYGNRMRLVRQMLFDQIGIEGEVALEQRHDIEWKGVRRSCVVLFKNIRELADTSLENEDDRWLLIIDFPFDVDGHGPADDRGRIQAFHESHPNGARTLCWIPAFLSQEAGKDLGTLVILDHILTGAGERFAQYATHLSPQDRQAAKSLLENQRSVLTQRVKSHLDAAYGLDALTPGSLAAGHDLDLGDRFASLCEGFSPRPPVAANLADALNQLLQQALEHQYPGAPAIEAEVRTSNLTKVWEVVRAAAQEPDGRTPVDKALRTIVRAIANPLKLGEMGADATHFVLSRDWHTHFIRRAPAAGSTVVVRDLRLWIDEPKAMGLPREAQNLIILAFAAMGDRAFYRHGSPFDATLTNIPDECDLREQSLPPLHEWQVAVARAKSIFDLDPSPLLNAGNVALLSDGVRTAADAAQKSCALYARDLGVRLSALGIPAATAPRAKTAAATTALLDQIEMAAEKDVVATLAVATVATTEAAMAECRRSAAGLITVLSSAGWGIFEALRQITDDRKPEADAVGLAVTEALQSDEHVVPLASALSAALSKAARLLARSAAPPPHPIPVDPPAPAPQPPPVHLTPGTRVVSRGTKVGLAIAAARSLLDDLTGETVDGAEVRVDVSWVVEKQES